MILTFMCAAGACKFCEPGKHPCEHRCHGLRPVPVTESLDPPEGEPSITCPRCGMTSYHPKDIENGFCGNCHDFTSAPDASGGRVIAEQPTRLADVIAERAPE